MNKKEIASILRDYHWMINEIQRQRKMLSDEVNGNFTAQYGIEASLPKGQNGDPIFREVIRREKKSRWIEKLEKKVMFIQEHMDCITNEREKVVLECLLDGMSMIAISKHMGLSVRHVQRIKNSIVDKMSEMSGLSGMSGKMRS
ncbi:LuxR C-terminal-related transcriptional regulator [Weizmannia sp. FSL W8-0676]|uniref:LuxR C-terminal-related transcriptional regulator n=1 Tax=Weizmannia sp. FSL W8-0676 TaxID=2954703 RepID=UPI003158179D